MLQLNTIACLKINLICLFSSHHNQGFWGFQCCFWPTEQLWKKINKTISNYTGWFGVYWSGLIKTYCQIGSWEIRKASFSTCLRMVWDIKRGWKGWRVISSFWTIAGTFSFLFTTIKKPKVGADLLKKNWSKALLHFTIAEKILLRQTFGTEDFLCLFNFIKRKLDLVFFIHAVFFIFCCFLCLFPRNQVVDEGKCFLPDEVEPIDSPDGKILPVPDGIRPIMKKHRIEVSTLWHMVKKKFIPKKSYITFFSKKIRLK